MISYDPLTWLGVPANKISMDSIKQAIQDDKTKRINFAYTQQHALRKEESNPEVVGWLNIPFKHSFELLAGHELSLNNFLLKKKNKDGFVAVIKEEETYNKFADYIEKYKDLVFLRDTLDLSIALSMHESEPHVRTSLGEHEYRVKYCSQELNSAEDLHAIVNVLQLRLEQLPFFKDADYVCCVPSSKRFLKDIVDCLKGFNFENISDSVSWGNKTESLKNVDDSLQKLEIISKWNLLVDIDKDLKGKSVLLIDDMYKSGVTMQYVALKLKESGAKRVYGIAIVKALGNS